MTMISFSRITAQKAALAIASAAFFMATAPGRALELDTFLVGVEECALPAPQSPLGAFVHSIVQRYGNAPGNPRAYAADRTNVAIVLPPEVAPAFGPATTRNFGEYTQVTVPVDGTLGGLPLSHMTLRIGNRNGIKAFMLVFSASRADVVDVFGDSIEYADNRGQDAGRRGDGYSAEIPFGEPGRITCDWSS
ncbi:hypothetical protein V5F38_13315 [Xanthobacter sp. V0B-10]|uniref:hypothetical protein n=1 Tax=Xanthobacter albus TaxID=3119929 RepID=UPI00372A1990